MVCNVVSVDCTACRVFMIWSYLIALTETATCHSDTFVRKCVDVSVSQ